MFTTGGGGVAGANTVVIGPQDPKASEPLPNQGGAAAIADPGTPAVVAGASTGGTSDVPIENSGCKAPEISPVAFGTRTEGSRVAAYLFTPQQQQLASFAAFGDAAREGVRLAVRQVGTSDYELITAPGPGADPTLRAFSSRGKPDATFVLKPYAEFRGGIRVAACDVNGDGRVDIITAPGRDGASLIKVFDRFDKDPAGNLKELASFPAFAEAANVEVFVACGDLEADGTAEIAVSLGAGAKPLARVYKLEANAGKLLAEFIPYDRKIEVEDDENPGGGKTEVDTYVDGASIALGDLSGDGRAEIVTGNLQGSPEVRTFSFGSDGVKSLKQIFPYGELKDHGVMVAVGQTDSSPDLEIIVGPASADELPRTHILAGSGEKKRADVFPYNATLDGGVEVAAVPSGAICTVKQ